MLQWLALSVIILISGGWVHGSGNGSLNPQGFTIFTPSTGTGTCGNSGSTYTGSCIAYVSSTGNDGTCASQVPPVTASPATTCATFSKALSLTRSFKPDWILFKAGDTPASPTTLAVFSSRGRSATEPLVVASYPTLIPTSSSDRGIIDFKDSPAGTGFFTSSTNNVQYLAIFGLKVTNSGRDPDSPNYSLAALAAQAGTVGRVVSPFGYLLIENNEFSYLNGTNIQNSHVPQTQPEFSGPAIIRRNSFHNFYATKNDATLPSGKRNGFNTICMFGIYFASLLLEDNFISNCGYFPSAQAGGTVTISNGSPAVVTWTDMGLPPAGIPPEGAWVGFTTTGALPTGLTAYTTTGCAATPNCYFVRNVSGNTANLSATAAGALIDTSSAGSGVHTGIWMDPSPDVFTHGVYNDLGWDGCPSNCDTVPYIITGPTTAKNNIVANASNIGLQIRNGGTIFNNLFYGNAAQVTCCAIATSITYNVALGAVGIRYAVFPAAQQFGFEIANYTCSTPATTNCPTAFVDMGLPTPGAAGTILSNNIAAHRAAGTANGNGIRLYPANSPGIGSNIPATTGVTVTANVVCDWTGSPNVQINDQGTGNNVHDNTTSTGDCSGLGFSDPTRTIGGYYTSIGGPGGATPDDFLNAAALASLSENWASMTAYRAPAVNSYIRAGFDMADP